MANKTLHSLQFPGLSDVYVLPEEASEFSTSSTYAVGQYVTYRGILYKCITAVTNAGSWTGATNWSATDVGTELQDTYGPSKPNFSVNNPVMDGTASTGTATTYARSDHRHPSDTNKLTIPDNAGTVGQALTKTATGSTWKTLIEGINPNLLRNWYFVGGGTGRGVFPVNSRGLTSYTATSAVTIDQWIKGDSSNLGEVSLTSGGLTISHSASTGYTQIVQNIVNAHTKSFELTPYYNKLATVSVLINNQLYSGQLYLGEQASSLALGGLAIFSIPGQQLMLRVNSSSSVTMIQAVKLELGDQQTLCHQENGAWVLNEIPDYEEEYCRCVVSDADSTDTYANQKIGNITVQCNSVGSSSLRYYNNLIQSTHKVLDSTFSNPAAQTSDITVTTYDGYLDFSNGFASGATTNITLVLGTSGPVLSTSTTAPS